MKRTYLSVINIIALAITLLVNYLSNTGAINGNTMASVSAKYQNLFTPAGYAFSIWGLIYLGLAAFVIFQSWVFFKQQYTEREKAVTQVGWWFLISCMANCLWIITWLYEYTGLSVLVMLVLLYALIKIVLNTGMEIYTATLRETVLVWWPFCLYVGWISLALIANIAAYLTKIGWDGFGLPDRVWAVVMIGIAGLLNLVVTWKRNMREFATVGAWGLIAIAVANWKVEVEVVTASLIVAGLLLISNVIHALKNFKGFLAIESKT